MRFFVSYSRSVKQQVGDVIRLLRAAGHEVWWDGDIPEIADWWATILDEIEQCQVFVFIVSEKSVESAYCLEELRYATDRNRPILPFVIDDHSRYTIPEAVSPMRNQWFLYDGDPARTLERLLKATDRISWQQYQDVYAPRPVEPGKGSGTLTKLFQQAVTLAEDGHFEEAIKRFRNVRSLDFEEWGEECQQWEACLRLYADIAEKAEHKATLPRAVKKWAEYTQRFGIDFDPFGLRAKLEANTAVGTRNGASDVGDLPKPDVPLRVRTITTISRSKVYEILPAPFEWVDIPAGKVTLEAGGYVPKGGQTFDVPAFQIAKYPVTNAQFAKFVEAGGYRQEQYWTAAGWEALKQGIARDDKSSSWKPTGKPWTEPRSWQDDTWNGAEYPVVGVSWLECVAFCRWLSEASGESILLPTEQQWQWAEQGDDGRAYPWGNEWDTSRCNTVESGIRRTTSVTQYPNGVSPYGAMNMSGNMWEWCLTVYASGSTADEGDERRVLRGGSFYSDRGNARAVFRNYSHPLDRNSRLGFRVVCRPPSSGAGR